MEGISDNEYAGGIETMITVLEISYVFGAPIALKSKAGKSVTLCSPEAKYVVHQKLTMKQSLKGIFLIPLL